MNAVGIDVSKGKSTVAILRPGGEVVASPFEVSHNPRELNGLVTLMKSLDGDTKIVMEYTGNYYLPVALFLRKVGLFVSVVNPILVKDYSNKSLTVRKGKTDKKDSIKLAAFALDRWNELPLFSSKSDTRTLLKSFNFSRSEYSVHYPRKENRRTREMDRFCPQIPALRVYFEKNILRFFQMLSFMVQEMRLQVLRRKSKGNLRVCL